MSIFSKIKISIYKISLVLFIVFFNQCASKENSSSAKDQKGFTFVFMTDIHLNPELGALEAFQKAIDTANALEPDFIMTGGDLVFDVLRGNFEKSNALFLLYKEAIKGFNAPVYNTIGNHDVFGIYPESDIDSTHPDYKYGMFERHLGKTYYSFDHKGWHFIVLNSIDEKDQRYIQVISDEQIEWLKKDLENVDLNTPISITSHIPFVSAYKQLHERDQLQVRNSKEVLDLFKDHNLRLVLQGHLHWLEDVYLAGKTHFITGGTVAGRPTWRGTKFIEEGFLLIKIKGESVTWDYIDYGWETRYSKLSAK